MTNDQLDEIERKLCVRYPDSFRAALPEFSKLCDKEPFKTDFITSVDEISELQGEIPDSLLPFMKAMQTDSFEVYAFDFSNAGSEYPIVVWAADAIVARWENFDAFASWLREWLAKAGS